MCFGKEMEYNMFEENEVLFKFSKSFICTYVKTYKISTEVSKLVRTVINISATKINVYI